MMNPVVSHLRRFLRDSIFVRVCVAIYGAMFLGFGAVLVFAFLPAQAYEWLGVAFGVVVGGFGLFMLYASVFGRLRLLEKAAEGVADGGEILGILLILVVLLAAYPITFVVKLLRSLRKQL